MFIVKLKHHKSFMNKNHFGLSIKESMKKEAILYQLGGHVWQLPIGRATM